jgi:hypothetical protein
MKSFRLLSAVAASALLISPSFAEDKTAPALAPGKPAGVQHATIAGTSLLGYGVLAIVVVGAVLVATSADSSRAATSTTP